MACKACEVWEVYPASTNDRTVATMDIVDAVLPSAVNAGERFSIQIQYKLCTVERRNTGDDALSHFPGYDGAWLRYLNLLHTRIEYWVWRMVEMGLTMLENPPATLYASPVTGEVKVDLHGRSHISPGQIFTFAWTGTIEELMGREFTSPTTVKLAWSIYGSNFWAHESDDWWPFDWAPSETDIDFSRVAWVRHNIQVNIPTPPPPNPDPIFNRDLCSISKTTVAPDETFKINITIDNQNETSGPYSVKCYCEGNESTLVTGTIAGYGRKTHSISVTANGLAGEVITESQYLSFAVTLFTAEGETDRWTPPSIAVIVEEPPPETSLTGRVSDSKTGSYLSGVKVTAGGYTTYTITDGSYTLELAPGSYQVVFSRSGYWPVTKSKTVVAGTNTLSVAMTPETEPEPEPGGVPWPLIIGAAAGVGIIVVAAQRRKHA